MTNEDVLAEIEQLGCLSIDRLFWIALSTDNRDLHSFLDEIDFEQYVQIIPWVEDTNNHRVKFATGYGGDWKAVMDEFGLFGFIAEVHIPHISNVFFGDDGEPQSWTVKLGVCSYHYVYAEDTDDLLEAIKDIYNRRLSEMVNEARKTS